MIHQSSTTDDRQCESVSRSDAYHDLRTFRTALAWVMLPMLLVSSVSQGQTPEVDWTRFRGPNGAGVAEHLKMPEQWSVRDFAWSTDLAGEGSSSPVGFGEKIFITSCHPETATLHVQCLDVACGEERWRRDFNAQPYRLHGRNSFASSTPCVDKERLYVAWAEPDHTMLVAMNHDGRELWRRDLGPWVSMHGFGTSPIRYGDLVILHCSQQAERLRPDQQPGHSRMIALDCRTGADVWETPLKTTIANYSVPCIRQGESGDELVCLAAAEGFFALNPADGRMVWHKSAFSMRAVASPVLSGDLILGSNGSGGGGNFLVAVRPEGQSAIEAFRFQRSANYVPTPVVFRGLAFLFGDKGVVSCLDATTGETVWQERMARGFSGSPVVIGDRVCAMDEAGRVLVFAATRGEPVVDEIALEEPTRATPCVIGDQVLFRTESHLHCLQVEVQSGANSPDTGARAR